MSDSQRTQIDIGVGILVGLCGYSPDEAFAELTAFAHRHKVGLISTTKALTLLAQTAPTTAGIENSATEAARLRWHSILQRADPQIIEHAA
ncbi:ANTAR domain-containing protein [Rhodococcoides kyotonense]|uniref:ANTAR domain-containing protein n=1 Tax=Rhodococcoides kyotonense TaxID=398843 RepID=A0A239G886_9NOCA|nr:ANTAR domain-containing protein [Rhodococcus kyotonensis]SNS65377.1 hypothetical protein SAMN05421642_104110 [Rhodococcus kyotonensis]